jgi:O-antigen ligase
MRLERLQLGLFAATAATCSLSIFAAQGFFGLAMAVYLWRLARGHTNPARLAVDGPLLAFVVWTLLSAAFAPDPLASHASAKKLVLFALLYVAVDSCASERVRERVVAVALFGGLALSAQSVLQYLVLGFDTVHDRPRGFLGHYMTAAGLEGAALVTAVARLLFPPAGGLIPEGRLRWRDFVPTAVLGAAVVGLTLLEHASLPHVLARRLFVAGMGIAGIAFVLRREPWPAGATVVAAAAAAVSAWALIVSQTRNAWLGAVFGLAAVLVLRAPRTLWLLATALAALLLARPASIAQRLTFSDASSVDRYYMWQAGFDMIRDKPIMGQGPGMILRVYPKYRWPEAPNPQQPHLHDNPLQIAAERGLPALVFWVWMMAVLLATALREARAGPGPPRFFGAAAFGTVLTLLVAGVFEYNFGDSEVLMFTLVVAALPFAARRGRMRRA